MDGFFDVRQIADGIKICTYKTDRFKTGRISFNIAVPLSQRVSDNAAAAYILSRTCGKYRDFSELNARLAELYGAVLNPSVSKVGEAQVIRLAMTMVNDRFALDDESIYKACATLLCDLVFDPNARDGAFDAGETEREKRLLLERIESEKNDKIAYARNRCVEIMCADEPYSINSCGTAEGAQALTAKSIYKAWQELLRHGVIQINVVGNADGGAVCDIVKERLKNIDRGSTAELKNIVVESAGRVKKAEEHSQIIQGKLVMGYRAGLTGGEDNLAPLRIMTDIFGGAPYSKLFVNVREKMSLCYYCAANLYRQKGIILVQSGIERENKEKAIEEIGNQLKAMQNGEITQDELDASKAGMKDALMRVADTPDDIDLWLYSQISDREFKSPQDIARELEAVTVQQVVDAAQKVRLDTIYMLSGEEEKSE